MDFHSIKWRTAMAAAMVAGSAAFMTAPAQALSIAQGSELRFAGTADFNANNVIDFNPNTVNLLPSTGSFAGATAAPGGVTIADVVDNNPINPFISGVQLSTGELVSFKLDKISAPFTTISGNGSGKIFDLFGSFFNASGDVAGKGLLNATFGDQSANGNAGFSGTIKAIPTPALLPGVIGMGIAAMRKRKAKPESAIKGA